MAIVRRGDVLANDGQCSAQAAWASLTPLGPEDPIEPGAPLHVITSTGVTRWTVSVDEHSIAVVPPRSHRAKPEPLLLASKNREPSPRARLEPRRLTEPVPDSTTLGAWLEARVGFRVGAVGQLTGTFGDGIDRVVVFEPTPWTDPGTDPEEAEPWRRSDVALLVSGETPKGWLPFGTPDDDAGGWEVGAYGLQPVAEVDLDGDGVSELLWLSQTIWGDPLWTEVAVSFFDGTSGFRVEALGGCSYNGCEAFLPESECRGVVKRLR